MEEKEHCHSRADALLLRMFEAMAWKIQEFPIPYINEAKDNLVRFKREHPEAMRYWLKWEILLNGPLEDLLAFMVSDTEEAKSARQAAPYTNVLLQRERLQIIKDFSMEWENRHRKESRE
jgi:hypothetical protein